MASVWFEGIEDLFVVAADLGKAGPRTRAMAAMVINKSLADIERDAKAIVPVDTGNLKNSITRTTATVTDLSGEVGPTAFYGGYVNWGTEFMDPQPYMDPAFDNNVEAFMAAMAQLAVPPI